jgi:DnaJ-domain-containing protein 1
MYASATSSCSDRRYSGATATHYEVLGVALSASHDEVKRAYTERALKYHPDRQGEQPPEARERAEFHMRELNAAWEVLRSPARRADYDSRLRGDTPVWEQRGIRAKRTAPVTPRVADLQPQQAGVKPTPSSGMHIGLVLAVVVVAVVAMLGFAAWATSSSSSTNDRDVNVQTGPTFDVNTCVTLASVGGRITPLPNECSAMGAFRIRQVLDLGRPCPGDLETFDLQADQIRLCLDGSGR